MLALLGLVRRGFDRMSMKGRVVVFVYSISLSIFSLLDIVALFLVASVFEFGQISDSEKITVDASTGKLVAIIVLYLSRSIFSILMSRIVLGQISLEESRLATENFRSLSRRQTILSGTPETHFNGAVERGVSALTTVIFNVCTFACEAVTALLVLGTIFWIEPIAASVATIFFLGASLIQHFMLSKRIQRLGTQVVSDMEHVYRFNLDAARLRAQLSPLSHESLVNHLRTRAISLAVARGRLTFYSTIPRYFLEIVMVMGLFVTGGVSFLTLGPSDALATVALLSAAAFRLLPSINRIQTLIFSTLANAPAADLALVEYPVENVQSTCLDSSSQFLLELEHVHYRYPSGSVDSLSDIQLQLSRGLQYAIVGASGAGKSTLAQMILRLITPTEGKVRSQSNLQTVFVPQDTHLAYASLAENVALTWDRSQIDYEKVLVALRNAGLPDFASRVHDSKPLLNDGFSGGQKQRIGLARAFYLGADIVVLDEVTSAVDTKTELEIVDQIALLRDSAAIIVIAHRPSTIRHADVIIHLDHGKIMTIDRRQNSPKVLR